MAISCTNIDSEALRLKAAFASCSVLKAADLDALVELVIAVRDCDAEQEEQDNRFLVVDVSYDGTTSDVATAFNDLTQFTVDQKDVLIIRAELTSGTKQVWVLSGIGKGDYGAGGTAILLTQFELLFETAAGVNLTLDPDTTTQEAADIPSANILKLNKATSASDGVMSKEDKDKLDSISNDAEQNVQPNWLQTNTSDDSYILNKPTNLSQFTDDIGAVNVNSDWSETNPSSLSFIENKPTIVDVTDLSNTPSSNELLVSSSTGSDTTILSATITEAGVMSSGDKIKLGGIEDGAEVNIQSDWDQTDILADDFIKNKPTLVGQTDLNTNYTTIEVEIESSTGNDTIINAATTSLAGVMTASDKVKLDGLSGSNLSLGLATSTGRVINIDTGLGVTIPESNSSEAGLQSSTNRDIVLEQATKHNFIGTSNPLITDDSSLDYVPGSVWINNAVGSVYVCVSNVAGSALWVNVGDNSVLAETEATEAFSPLASSSTVTLANTPIAGKHLIVFRNGSEQTNSVLSDYTISGQVITFNTPFSASEIIKVYYKHN